MKISVVIPGYNEEGNVNEIASQLRNVLQTYESYEIIFVDDGSSDHTLEAVQRLHQEDHRVNYISLSRNFGHQNALMAGIDLNCR